MPGIPESILEEIKERTDLVQLVSEHVALKRSGARWVGLCPFHAEKTPSFTVNPDRGFFHCFGCNAGGNVFTFLMRVTGLSFPEAVRTLASRVGVSVPESQARDGLERLAAANERAADLFRRSLQDPHSGARARAYLERRGINAETVARFRLGYAPAAGWPERLERSGVARGDLLALGLAAPGRGGGVYPRLRDRVVFPIEDLSGRVVAFGARAISDDVEPKYLNSPETPLYRKGRHLYGLVGAREAARRADRLILVEGYLDAIALAQAGVENVAAVLGTAVTVEQLRLARRFAADLVLCFDGDEAGRRAALRVFPLCVENVDLWPRAAFLPAGEDPDSVLRTRGRAEFEEIAAAAVPLVDFFLDDLAGSGGGVGAAARAGRRVAQILARVRDPIVRDQLVRGAAVRLGVSPSALLAAARSAAGSTRQAGSRPLLSPRRPAPRTARFSAEAELVELAVCYRDAAVRMASERVLDRFRDPELRALGQRVLEWRAGPDPFDPRSVLGELPADMAERVRRRLEAEGGEEAATRALEEWFRRHRDQLARESRRALIEELQRAERRGDAAAVAAALEALRASLRSAREED